MSDWDGMVERIAALVGIDAGYTDAFGRQAWTPLETRRAILADFGLPTATEAEARDSLAHIETMREGVLPPVLSTEAGSEASIPLGLSPEGTITWRVTGEDDTTREGRAVVTYDGQVSRFALPPLAAGYYSLRVETGRHDVTATIIAAPRRCWEPEEYRRGTRLWGVTAQVYGLRSARQIGIGDYSDVAEAAHGAGGLGASFLGLSPLHALFAADRSKISPYSPSSRLFLETVHIDPTAVDGFAGSAAARLLERSDIRRAIASLAANQLVDHAAVWDIKRQLLDALWLDFVRGGKTPAAFEGFCREMGGPLRAHATFEALSEHFRAQGRAWLGEWPAAFREAGSAEVRQFESDHFERIAYHSWLQWLADEQLQRAADAAHRGGMSFGLYRDLAVGSDRGGSEVWSAPHRFGASLSVGAPPDQIAPNGQNWGLPPFNPLTLESEGLAAFRALVSANMRHAGAIRIDHAFQLRRLFAIPLGTPAEKGAYVRYPLDAMLAVLKLESHRSKCLVIAEDLGTAPGGFSDAIMDAGVLSYRVLWFEREHDGGFKAPADYPRRAIAVINTHDMATFAGWWRGLDVDLRQTLGLYDRELAERERAARAEDRRRLADTLKHERLIGEAATPEEAPLEAAVRFIARTNSFLASIQLEDSAGELNQPNLPGIDQGHPNWQRRFSVDVTELMAPGGNLAKLAAAIASEGRGLRPRAGTLAAPPPRATYRLQFHGGFTFDDAVQIVPYLARLGISHVYASPILKARPASMHGYDIVDHGEINPELGGEEAFIRLSDTMRAHGLGLVLDIVPNHMGVGGADNPWWLSVLEWGELSPYARIFDIDWERLGANHKLVAPFLADRYGIVLETGGLKLAFDRRDGSFSVWHHEHRFPVSPLSYPIILDRALAALGDARVPAEVIGIAERLRAMDHETSADRRAAFPEETERLKRQLAALASADHAMVEAIERACALINGTQGVHESFGTLHRILEAQAYRLAYWRVAASDINYRRFFDINELAGVRTEDPEVFAKTHASIFRLIREARVHGLRIDHIDGLANPAGYLRDLQAAVGPGFYVVAEKILEPGEKLRRWPMAGTSGYDALNLLEGVFIDHDAAPRFERLYRAYTGLEGSPSSLLRRSKDDVLDMSFASELESLASDLKRIAEADTHTRDYTLNALRRAIAEIIVRFPVYRTYLGDGEVSEQDRRIIEGAVEAAKRASALADRTEHDLVKAVLLGSVDAEGPGRPHPALIARFRRRFQQFTGPVMAKSLEDTFFYRYVRLIALNEVGGDPRHFGVDVEAFHRANKERAETWPYGLIATASHDTKRGEDARARIGALSQIPDAWEAALGSWQELSAPHLTPLEESEAPDRNDQYLILQSLLGAWPVELLDEVSDGDALAAFGQRICDFAVKALREAKRHTSWVNPDETYERATLGLIGKVLDPNSRVLDAMRPLARRLAFMGALTSLAKVVLKTTLPGVPDIYHGSELWDLALVDPDNRRPVDFLARERALVQQEPAEALWSHWRDGRIKQRVLAQLLADRLQAPLLYSDGSYERMAANGVRGGNCLAFRRIYGSDRLVVAVPRGVAAAANGEDTVPAQFWRDTRLPVGRGRWRDILTGATIETDEEAWPLSEVFARLPVAALRMVG
jgi:(1->4)-alpha-D-glucan 1-alpha-D-glucosylmutase